MTRNLTEGKPLSLLLTFFFPVFLGNMVQTVFNMTDTFIVGRFIGTQALAALGATSPLYFVVTGTVGGLCGGFAIPVAQAFGAGDLRETRRYVAQVAYLAIALTVLLTAVALLLARPALGWINTPADVLDQARTYITIIFCGIGATLLYNTMAAIFRAVGDSRTPMLFLLMSSVLHVALDLVLIVWGGLGVLGAGIATVTAQLLAGTCCLVVWYRRYPHFRLQREDRRPDLPKVRRLLGMGLPMALQYFVTGIGTTMVQATMNTFGSLTVAAVSAASKAQMIGIQSLEAMGPTIATFCGQNIGAGRLDRVRQGVRYCLLMTLGIAVFAIAMIFAFGPMLSGLFLDRGDPNLAQMMATVRQYTWYNTPFLLVAATLVTLRNTLQGLGYPVYAMLAGISECFGRVLIVVVLAPAFGFAGACLANPVAWSCANLILLPLFFGTMRRLRRREGTLDAPGVPVG